MHAVWKGAAETLAVVSGAASAARRLHRGRAAVLAYHNVVPDSDRGRGQATLHVALSDFRRQMDRLSATHEIVPLGQLVDGSFRELEAQRPLAALTFDDAYAGAVKLGILEVADRGLPATVFVSPARLGGVYFWWDRLADDQGGVLGSEVRRWALDEMAGHQERVLESLDRGAEGPTNLPDCLRTATESELADAENRPGISVASHGWSHLNLAGVSQEVLDRELLRSARWLRSRFSGCLPVLSYPYGSSAPRVRERVRDAGYIAALEINGGWLSSKLGDVFALPRMNVPAGVSLRGFEILTSGLRSLG